MTVYDIAGLTRGASTGAGLGNAFLSHIRAVDAIFQVVRCFDDAEIIHVEGDVDPIRDLDIISEELRLKDIEFVEKAHENLVKQTRRGGQSLEMKKLKEEGKIGNKVAIVNVADAFGIELANAGRPIFQQAGFDIVYDKSYPLGTQDYSPVMKAAKAANPDAFVAWSYPPDTFGLAECPSRSKTSPTPGVASRIPLT